MCSDNMALTKKLPITAQRPCLAGLALSGTFGDTSPKGRGLCAPALTESFFVSVKLYFTAF